MRRFPIEVPLTFAALAERIRTVFGVGAQDTLVLKYQDNEGDLITVSTDVELAEALRLSGSLLRLELAVRPVAAAPKPAAKAAAKPAATSPSPAPPAKAPAKAAPVATVPPKAAAAKSPPAPTALSVAASPAADSSNSTPTPATAVTPGGPTPQEPVPSASVRILHA